MLQREGYLPRVLDTRVEQLLRAFGAVEVVGSMWCGKTWMAEAHANSKVSLADQNIKDLVEADSNLAFDGEAPRLIDEWQELPGLWDKTRLRIDDAGGKRGMFILTGSSTPAKDQVSHSGTGRIARLHLRPMSLFETGNSSGEISLSGLFEGRFKAAQASTGLKAIAELIICGGWPGSLGLSTSDRMLIPEQYLDTLISSLVAKEGVNEQRFRNLLVSLARNIGQAATYQTIGTDLAGGDLSGKREVAGRQQVEALIAKARNRFIIEDLAGWDAPIRSKSRLRTKPKRTFVDPSLPASLLGAGPQRLLQNAQLFGQLFEELCLRDLRIYASAMDQALPNPVMYYRDSDGLEVDAIIEVRDGRWAAIEIKLGENKVPEAIASLTRLKNKVSANPLAQNPLPSFMAVLVGNTPFCRRTPEGIYVIPINMLGV
jgi:predicted AAA+ superfamily ATPase